MAYNILYQDQTVDPIGKAPIVLNVGVTDSLSTSLTLTGKGAANYGTAQQTNLLHILESFASPTAPDNATVGQLWYDSAEEKLKVLVQKVPSYIWKATGGIQISDGIPPTNPALGDQWFERTGAASGFLYVYTGIGRYPTTSTTIGGWDQIWPQVETFGGRDEYDGLRLILEELIGSSVGSWGSGALGKSVQNLTDFGALDLDLRTKYQALLPLDVNVLYSENTGVDVDREVTRQAPSTTLFYFNDSISPSDGYIGGLLAGVPTAGQPGSIYVDGVSTVVPAGAINHEFQVDDATVIWDQTNTLLPGNSYFVTRRLDSGQWQFDNGAAWVSFTPTAGMYAIGTMSTFADDNNLVYPTDRTTILWMHAVRLVGTKVEQLKVEPNSQDWDVLLAAAKQAINRLELPSSFLKSISPLPFVGDGRPVNPTLMGLDSSSDVRFPSAARRSNRKAGIVTQVQNFSETVNALKTAVENRFSLKGINGASGTNPTFPANIVTTTWVGPPTAGMSGTAASGTGFLTLRFVFDNDYSMNQFIASGAAIQLEVTHTGGALAGDTNFRSLLTAAGTWRITGDKVRIFGQSLPLTASRSSATKGLWNANIPGQLLTTQWQNPATSTGASMSATAYRLNGLSFNVRIDFAAGSALAGVTAMTFKLIQDTEQYLPGPTNVYASPRAFIAGDIIAGL